MKKTCIVIILFLTYNFAFGQSLTIFEIDTTNFPTMKANFYAFDKDGNQITNLNPSDFKITEDGKQRIITNITCPVPKQPIALSSVLVFDVSSSMIDGPPRIESAKKAANAWVDELNLGLSECALVTFSDYSYIQQDFTTDGQKLKESISKIGPTRGTNYHQALIGDLTSGLQVAKTGKYKRVIIFLTDGLPNSEPKTSEIIKFANDNNISIFAVTLDMPAPQSIKDMTLQTGGKYFENINGTKETEKIFKNILHTLQDNKPCNITWESEVSCSNQITFLKIELKSLGINDIAGYNSPVNSNPKLEINPEKVDFKNIIPGIKRDTVITVTAKNSSFQINDILLSNQAFSISPKSFSLKSGESRNLTLSYLAADSGYNFCKIEFQTDKCNASFNVNGGYPGKLPEIKTLKLIQPNGGEFFIAGSDTVITWEGVSPYEQVTLKYRTSDNEPWILISDTAKGHTYTWRVPLIESNECLLTVTVNDPFKSGCGNPDVQICNRFWMGCNLNVETYRNGDSIMHAVTNEDWIWAKHREKGAWGYYYNKTENGIIFGKLYNWYAVNDKRGLAPKGWKIPNDEDWIEMEKCLGGYEVAGDKIKSAGNVISGDGLWLEGNNSTNETGFTALPGGCNCIANVGSSAYFWTSTLNGNRAIARILSYNSSSIESEDFEKSAAFSVRCIRE